MTLNTTGESVLSLLIVEVTNEIPAFYFTFYFGIVSVTGLQYLYFRSQPHHADDHAMRRKRSAAATFLTCMQYYSAALIIVGVSFKLLLTEYKYEEAYASKSVMYRLLAGESDTKLEYTKSERRFRISLFFCVALGTTFLCLDILALAHKGIEAINDQYFQRQNTYYRLVAYCLLASRIAVTIFISTAFLYVREVQYVALIGLISILLQVFLRVIGFIFFPPSGLGHGHDSKDSLENEENEEFEDH